jgi:hypothetical protein
MFSFIPFIFKIIWYHGEYIKITVTHHDLTEAILNSFYKINSFWKIMVSHCHSGISILIPKHIKDIVCHIMHVLAYIILLLLPRFKILMTLYVILYVFIFICPLLFNFYNLNDFKYINKKDNVFDIKNFGVNIFFLIYFYIFIF